MGYRIELLCCALDSNGSDQDMYTGRERGKEASPNPRSKEDLREILTHKEVMSSV